MSRSISIKELHATTGAWVRKAGESATPITVTDRGKVVALLARPSLVRMSPRRRVLLPEFEAMLKRSSPGDLQADLDAIRGDR